MANPRAQRPPSPEPAPEVAGCTTAPVFAKKLFTLVSSEPDDIICWSSDGSSFEVKSPPMLEAQCLAKYYRHSKFPSLVRQLNFYSFKKTSKARNHWVYQHPCFHRDHPELLDDLRRKTNMGAVLVSQQTAEPAATSPAADADSASSAASGSSRLRASASRASSLRAVEEKRGHKRRAPAASAASAARMPASREPEGEFDAAFGSDLREIAESVPLPTAGSARASKRAKMFALMQHLRGPRLSPKAAAAAIATAASMAPPSKRTQSPVTALVAPDLTGSEYNGELDGAFSPRVLYGAVEQSVHPVLSWGGQRFNPVPVVSPSSAVVLDGVAADSWEDVVSSPELGPASPPIAPMKELVLPELPDLDLSFS